MGSVGADQLEARHMAAEAAREVVILAVNVIGNCAADSYIFSARRHRQKESAWYREVENFRQSCPGFAAEDASCGIEMQEAIHAARLQQRPVFEQADIAIAAASAHGQLLGRGWSAQGKITLPAQRHQLG